MCEELINIVLFYESTKVRFKFDIENYKNKTPHALVGAGSYDTNQ